MEFEFIKCSINNQTFKVKAIKELVERECEGLVLNLFAGTTILNINEVRNDLNAYIKADYNLEALEFLNQWTGKKFNTIIMDPPYSYRKSMEYYEGVKNSKFKLVKDNIHKVIAANGKIITFGYHSIVMGRDRGYTLEKIVVLSHGGAIHDTIVSIERRGY